MRPKSGYGSLSVKIMLMCHIAYKAQIMQYPNIRQPGLLLLQTNKEGVIVRRYTFQKTRLRRYEDVIAYFVSWIH